jgi:hypothetical protein
VLQRWPHACLVIVLIASLAGCGGTEKRTTGSASAPEKTHITIGLAVPGATYLPIYLGSDAGLFAKEGLDADLEFRGGSDLIKAIASGSVDFGVSRTCDGFIEYMYEDGRLPSQKALDLFFDMAIQVGRHKERWPLAKYWTPMYVDSYSQWNPAST